MNGWGATWADVIGTAICFGIMIFVAWATGVI